MTEQTERLAQIKARAEAPNQFSLIANVGQDTPYLLDRLAELEATIQRVRDLVTSAEEDRRVVQDGNPTTRIAYPSVDVDDLAAALDGQEM